MTCFKLLNLGHNAESCVACPGAESCTFPAPWGREGGGGRVLPVPKNVMWMFTEPQIRICVTTNNLMLLLHLHCLWFNIHKIYIHLYVKEQYLQNSIISSS